MWAGAVSPEAFSLAGRHHLLPCPHMASLCAHLSWCLCLSQLSLDVRASGRMDQGSPSGLVGMCLKERPLSPNTVTCRGPGELGLPHMNSGGMTYFISGAPSDSLFSICLSDPQPPSRASPRGQLRAGVWLPPPEHSEDPAAAEQGARPPRNRGGLGRQERDVGSSLPMRLQRDGNTGH